MSTKTGEVTYRMVRAGHGYGEGQRVMARCGGEVTIYTEPKGGEQIPSKFWLLRDKVSLVPSEGGPCSFGEIRDWWSNHTLAQKVEVDYHYPAVQALRGLFKGSTYNITNPMVVNEWLAQDRICLDVTATVKSTNGKTEASANFFVVLIPDGAPVSINIWKETGSVDRLLGADCPRNWRYDTTSNKWIAVNGDTDRLTYAVRMALRQALAEVGQDGDCEIGDVSEETSSRGTYWYNGALVVHHKFDVHHVAVGAGFGLKVEATVLPNTTTVTTLKVTALLPRRNGPNGFYGTVFVYNDGTCMVA